MVESLHASGTFVDGKELEKNQIVQLYPNSIITLVERSFRYDNPWMAELAAKENDICQSNAPPTELFQALPTKELSETPSKKFPTEQSTTTPKKSTLPPDNNNLANTPNKRGTPLKAVLDQIIPVSNKKTPNKLVFSPRKDSFTVQPVESAHPPTTSIPNSPKNWKVDQNLSPGIPRSPSGNGSGFTVTPTKQYSPSKTPNSVSKFAISGIPSCGSNVTEEHIVNSDAPNVLASLLPASTLATPPTGHSRLMECNIASAEKPSSLLPDQNIATPLTPALKTPLATSAHQSPHHTTLTSSNIGRLTPAGYRSPIPGSPTIVDKEITASPKLAKGKVYDDYDDAANFDDNGDHDDNGGHSSSSRSLLTHAEMEGVEPSSNNFDDNVEKNQLPIDDSNIESNVDMASGLCADEMEGIEPLVSAHDNDIVMNDSEIPSTLPEHQAITQQLPPQSNVQSVEQDSSNTADNYEAKLLNQDCSSVPEDSTCEPLLPLEHLGKDENGVESNVIDNNIDNDHDGSRKADDHHEDSHDAVNSRDGSHDAVDSHDGSHNVVDSHDSDRDTGNNHENNINISVPNEPMDIVENLNNDHDQANETLNDTLVIQPLDKVVSCVNEDNEMSTIENHLNVNGASAESDIKAHCPADDEALKQNLQISESIQTENISPQPETQNLPVQIDMVGIVDEQSEVAQHTPRRSTRLRTVASVALTPKSISKLSNTPAQELQKQAVQEKTLSVKSSAKAIKDKPISIEPLAVEIKLVKESKSPNTVPRSSQRKKEPTSITQEEKPKAVKTPSTRTKELDSKSNEKSTAKKKYSESAKKIATPLEAVVDKTTPATSKKVKEVSSSKQSTAKKSQRTAASNDKQPSLDNHSTPKEAPTSTRNSTATKTKPPGSSVRKAGPPKSSIKKAEPSISSTKKAGPPGSSAKKAELPKSAKLSTTAKKSGKKPANVNESSDDDMLSPSLHPKAARAKQTSDKAAAKAQIKPSLDIDSTNEHDQAASENIEPTNTLSHKGTRTGRGGKRKTADLSSDPTTAVSSPLLSATDANTPRRKSARNHK